MKFDDKDIFWFQRRSFVQAAAAFTAGGMFTAAQAQSRSNIVELNGDAMLNKSRLQPGTVIQSGDVIETGPGSRLTFMIGDASFHMRQNSLMKVERGESINAVSVLRLLTGGLAAVFGKGNQRRVITPTLTAGIRGTGLYVEAEPIRSYFCNCYGTIDLVAGAGRVTTTTDYHDSFWASSIMPKDGKNIWPSPPRNHTDEELETLARVLSLTTAWQTMPADVRKRKMDEKGGAYAPAK
jgi:hypothetical protein